jgi:Zn-dependent protease with chaperone function
MSTQLGPAPAGEHAEHGSAGDRVSVFALPARTSFRFALLTAAVAASSFTFYQLIYLSTPRASALISRMRSCRAQALAHRPGGMPAIVSLASALHQASVCYSGAERTEAWWGLLGVGVLIAAASVIFLAQPWWYRRRRHLSELTGDDAAELVSRLEGVRQRAGTGPVVWLLQPLNARLSAFAFGRPGRRFVAVSGGAAVAAVRKPAAFDAVILHELAHIKNRDIDQTYLTLAIWRAFVVAALLPLVVTVIVTGDLGGWQRALWRVAVLALIVYLLRNAVLRSREFDADARVRELDPQTQLGPVLAALPARAGRRAWHLGWTHPSAPARAAALVDPAPLYRCGVWDGLAVGLVTAIGTSAVREIVTLTTTTDGIKLLVPAVIFGALAGAALAIAMWRNQLLETGTGTVKGWAAGAGLGLGLAAGSVIALPQAFGRLPLAPDQLTPAAVGVLAVWTGFAVLIFMPFPVWVGHWADAWQQRSGMTAPRVPARGGMVAAAVGAWAVMAAGLYLVLVSEIGILVGSSAASVWHQLPELLRGMGSIITAPGGGELGGWVVCLVIVGVPLAAAIAHRRWRRSGDGRDAALPGWRPVAIALLCAVGCLAAVALMLALSAVTHARIAEPVRWSPDFLGRLVFFEEQAIVVVAVVCALIAAAMARSARTVALSVVVGAAVAAAGAVALPTAGDIGHCFSALSIRYAHPPAGNCLTGPDSAIVRPTVLGAALVSILFVPAAYAAGMLASRGIRRARPATGARALGWLAAGIASIAAIAAVAGTALWGPGASARGVTAAGSIGRDGWISGNGYEVRLVPNWYAATQSRAQGLIVISFPFDGAKIGLLSPPASKSIKAADFRNALLQFGARPALLGGAPGLHIARQGLPAGILEQWFIVRGPEVYLITLNKSPDFPGDSPYLRDSLTRMLRTWHWTKTG